MAIADMLVNIALSTRVKPIASAPKNSTTCSRGPPNFTFRRSRFGYVGSIMRRSSSEVSGILAAVESKIGALAADPATRRLGVRVRAVGRLELLPPSTVAVLRQAETATAAHAGLKLTIAIAYGGREDIRARRPRSHSREDRTRRLARSDSR